MAKNDAAPTPNDMSLMLQRVHMIRITAKDQCTNTGTSRIVNIFVNLYWLSFIGKYNVELSGEHNRG